MPEEKWQTISYMISIESTVKFDKADFSIKVRAFLKLRNRRRSRHFVISNTESFKSETDLILKLQYGRVLCLLLIRSRSN